MSEVVPLTRKALCVLHTLLLAKVPFHCEAAHGLESKTGRRGGQAGSGPAARSSGTERGGCILIAHSRILENH